MLLHPEPQPDADPRRYVERFIEAHRQSLSVYHAILEAAVAEAYARWELKFPDPTTIPGAALCSDVRTLMMHRSQKYTNKDRTLFFVRRHSSWQLADQARSKTVRIRKQPYNARTLRPDSLRPYRVDTLFGVDYMWPFELAILWGPDASTQALGDVCLAAVAGLDDADNPPAIYVRCELPPPSVMDSTTMGGDTRRTVEPSDDFDDQFPADGLGTNPA